MTKIETRMDESFELCREYIPNHRLSCMEARDWFKFGYNAGEASMALSALYQQIDLEDAVPQFLYECSFVAWVVFDPAIGSPIHACSSRSEANDHINDALMRGVEGAEEWQFRKMVQEHSDAGIPMVGQQEWIRVRDRTPSESEGDEWHKNVWYYTPGIHPEICVSTWAYVPRGATHWMPTGLRKPKPPESK